MQQTLTESSKSSKKGHLRVKSTYEPNGWPILEVAHLSFTTNPRTQGFEGFMHQHLFLRQGVYLKQNRSLLPRGIH